jgi:mRNA-degrading endonuclease RelE of RelBE toxin-antitoxin system
MTGRHTMKCCEARMADVIILDTAQDEIDALPRSIAIRMAKLIERLSRWPEVSGVKSLRGDLAGKFRPRTGDYRLQFRVEARKVKTRPRARK